MTPKELRAWRQEHGFSPAELAKALGIARSTVYRWEAEQMDMPSYLAEELVTVLAKREAAKAEAPQAYYIDPETFVLESEQPHGSLIGFKRHFWMEWTDAQRQAWIIAADNPLTALPWPWWSHGWEWYPPKPLGRERIMPAKQPHYLLKSGMIELQKQISLSPGISESNKLCAAVIYFCRRDFPEWLTPTGTKSIDVSAYRRLKAIMVENDTP